MNRIVPAAARRCRALLPLLVVVTVGGCAQPLQIEQFAGDGVDFDPVRFFTGHLRSWGVLEGRDGAPVGRVRTESTGEAEGDGGLHMVQTLTMEDGTEQRRDWHMRRLPDHRFEATANDMVGTASGEARGRVFHWRWVLATKPGNSLRDVTMEQWMYLMDDGAMVNRTMVSKFGVILAEVTEQFVRAP